MPVDGGVWSLLMEDADSNQQLDHDLSVTEQLMIEAKERLDHEEQEFYSDNEVLDNRLWKVSVVIEIVLSSVLALSSVQ